MDQDQSSIRTTPIGESQSQPLSQPVTKPKKQAPIWLVVILIVIIVIGAAVAAYFIWFNKPADDKSSKSNHNTTTKVEPKDETDYALDVKNELLPVVSEQINNAENSGSWGYVVDEGTGSPAYKTEGFDFFTDANGKGYSADVSRDSTSTYSGALYTAVFKALQNKIVTLGFKEYFYGMGDAFYADGASVNDAGERVEAYYTNDHVICYISSMSFSCANLADYPAAAKAYKPFVEAMRASADPTTNQGPQVKTAYGGLNITNSRIKPYQKAQIGVHSFPTGGGYVALFYRVDKNATWKFFRGLQQAPSCDEFNTPDLKKAFVDDSCYSGNQLTLVKTD
ncbi:hypothetical protein FWF48_02345 [Candidatus Saccharibacteria bacterium]|nr:hypothetical protein [Candidatus Saccharibacteria bacterium]